MSSNRGAQALGKRLEPLVAPGAPVSAMVDAILGSEGRFIPDAHEPFVGQDRMICCSCGAENLDRPGESYFDHIDADGK